MRFSASTKGFYGSDINYPSLPSDLVTITDAEHAALMAAQAAGQEIIADANGKPIAVAPQAASEPPILNRVQWGAFLDMTGFRALSDNALSALPKTIPAEIAEWALLKNVISESQFYRLDTALSLIAKVRAILPTVTLPSDAQVSAAWTAAASLSVETLLAP